MLQQFIKNHFMFHKKRQERYQSCELVAAHMHFMEKRAHRVALSNQLYLMYVHLPVVANPRSAPLKWKDALAKYKNRIGSMEKRNCAGGRSWGALKVCARGGKCFLFHLSGAVNFNARRLSNTPNPNLSQRI